MRLPFIVAALIAFTVSTAFPADAQSTKAMALEFLMRHAPVALKCQREDGAFFPFPEWKQPSRYHQYCLYPLAYLYVTPEAGKFYHDPALLNAVRASMRYMSGLIKPDGTSPVYSRGGHWGDTLDDWWPYFALESWQIVRGHLTPEENALWEKIIRRCVEGCVKHVERTLADPKFPNADSVANHFVWFLLSVFRAGKVFAQDDWCRLAEGGLQRVIAVQQPGGYWHEGGGPTTLYNFVTTDAISLYAIETGNAAAWQAVRKAEEFHRAFTYPDGVPVETIDGRVHYTGRPMMIIPAGFTHSPTGQAYVQRQIASLMRQPVEDFLQGYSFFTDVARHADNAEPVETPLPLHVLPNRLAAITCSHGWVCAASAIVNRSVKSRWFQDRQNHLSLWHSRTGLIFGGGNSIGQPAFSTVVVEKPDGSAQAFVASAAELLLAEHSRLAIALTVGGERVEIAVRLEDRRTVRLEALWRGPGHGPCVWQLPLRLDRSAKIIASRKTHALGDRNLTLTGADLGDNLSYSAWRLQWQDAAGATFRWPVEQFTPYFKDGKPDKSDPASHAAYGVLELRLRESVPVRVKFTITE
ncbi:MAG: hypothetical protein WCV00_15995 [Verrucomicrobiia bacterium]|jgi:hypothetical protein